MPSVPIISFLVPETVDSGETFAITATIQNREDRPLQAKLELVNQTLGTTLKTQTWTLDALEMKSVAATTSITTETTFAARAKVLFEGIWVPSDYKTKTVAVTVPPPPPEEGPPPEEIPPEAENIVITNVTAPEEVEPEEPFTITATVRNNTGHIRRTRLIIVNTETQETIGSRVQNIGPNISFTLTAETSIQHTTTFQITASRRTAPDVWTPTDTKTITVTVPGAAPPEEIPPEEEIPPTPSECPDFWSDPVGAVTCWIISSLEQTLNLMAGGFYSLLNTVKDFVDNLLPTIKDFFSDPMGHVRDYVENTWTWINDIAGKITGVIGEWWNDTSKTVQSWINAAVENIQDFIENPIGYLNDWLNTAKTTIQGWINSAIQGIQDFIQNFPTHVQNWWNTSINPIFETVRSTVEKLSGWINNAYKNISDWWTDIFKYVQQWTNNRLQGIQNWVQGITQDIQETIQDLSQSIAPAIAEAILNMKDWVESYFMENMMSMFGWINDIKDAIGNAINFFIDLYKMITGEKEIPGTENTLGEELTKMYNDVKTILEGE